jgi:hypothetical protein
MGWENAHLHCFRGGQIQYSSPAPGTDFEDSGDESDETVRLNEIARREKAKWNRDTWDAEAFDLGGANADLRRLGRYWKKQGID